MKFIKNKTFLVCVFALFTISMVSTKNLKETSEEKKEEQVHVVSDQNGFSADLAHVVRRTPTISTVTNVGNFRLNPPSNMISMSNSNTNNGPNVGDLGKTATIVYPHVVVHSKTPISVMKETPAHIGYRNEQKSLTSLNLETGKTESHTINNKVPIYGNIQEVKTVYKNDVRSYDIDNKQWGPIQSSISQS